MKKIVMLFCVLFFNSAFADKVAIIGGGAAGLVTAWLLESNHEVTLYEAQNRLGGNADSVEVNVNGETVTVEAGVDFFNQDYYPHFLKLLRYFEIPLKTFTLVSTFYTINGRDVYILPPFHDGTTEWRSFTLENLCRSIQLKIVVDNASKLINAHDTHITLENFLNSLAITTSFKTKFLYPFLAAAWGVKTNEIHDFAAYEAIKYLVEGNNTKNYQWYAMPNGLKTYIAAVSEDLKNTQIKLNAAVTHIAYNNGIYTVIAADGSTQMYDQLIFATAHDVASNLLRDIPENADLSALLAKVTYYETKIAIHSDPRFMPPSKDDWRVVNIRYDGVNAETTMYKSWISKTPIFKSWITYPVGKPLPDHLYALIPFKHPNIDLVYFQVQDAVTQLQGINHLWFAGMWTYDNASHESAIVSAINIAQHLAPESERLRVLE